MGQYAPLLIAGTQLAGAGLGLAGSMTQASGIEAEGKAAQQAALYNAELAKIEAARAIEGGYEEEARLRTQGRRFLAQRRVAAAKSGFAFEGTPLAALVADAKQLELDALRARRAGLEAGEGSLRTAALETSRAKSVRRIGDTAAKGTLISGVSGALVGIGNAGATYYSLKNPRP